MYGDAGEASNASSKIFLLSDEEKKKTFFFKPLWQRFLIVLAGPLANYLLSFVLLVVIFFCYGESYTVPSISKVEQSSPAYKYGLREGDYIVEVDGRNVDSFSDLQRVVSLNPEISLSFLVRREGRMVSFDVTPRRKDTKDYFGNDVSLGVVGITSQAVKYREISLMEAVPKSLNEVYDVSVLTLATLKQIILGQRSLSDLSGPVRIAQYSGQVTKKAFTEVPGEFRPYLILWFMAMISLNLGLVNLLPIPVLDGGHLFMYLVEGVRRKAISFKAQETAFKIGVSFLLLVFSFVIINDLKIVFG